jgi:hypothetical protein
MGAAGRLAAKWGRRRTSGLARSEAARRPSVAAFRSAVTTPAWRQGAAAAEKAAWGEGGHSSQGKGWATAGVRRRTGGRRKGQWPTGKSANGREGHPLRPHDSAAAPPQTRPAWQRPRAPRWRAQQRRTRKRRRRRRACTAAQPQSVPRPPVGSRPQGRGQAQKRPGGRAGGVNYVCWLGCQRAHALTRARRQHAQPSRRLLLLPTPRLPLLCGARSFGPPALAAAGAPAAKALKQSLHHTPTPVPRRAQSAPARLSAGQAAHPREASAARRGAPRRVRARQGHERREVGSDLLWRRRGGALDERRRERLRAGGAAKEGAARARRWALQAPAVRPPGLRRPRGCAACPHDAAGIQVRLPQRRLRGRSCSTPPRDARPGLPAARRRGAFWAGRGCVAGQRAVRPAARGQAGGRAGGRAGWRAGGQEGTPSSRSRVRTCHCGRSKGSTQPPSRRIAPAARSARERQPGVTAALPARALLSSVLSSVEAWVRAGAGEGCDEAGAARAWGRRGACWTEPSCSGQADCARCQSLRVCGVEGPQLPRRAPAPRPATRQAGPCTPAAPCNLPVPGPPDRAPHAAPHLVWRELLPHRGARRERL